jgi:hypothetical protein
MDAADQAMPEKSLPLPVAMRSEEISEQDFDTLCRIAEDAKAAGRQERVSRRVPLRKRDAVNS